MGVPPPPALLEGSSVDIGAGFLSVPAIECVLQQSDPPRFHGPLDEPMDRYRIEHLLGQGGMGSVYLARRIDVPHLPPVALKLLRPKQHSVGMIERFKREGMILSRLAHRHIARLLDVGSTAAGSPYLVMEFVDGQPIRHYADDVPLDVGQRAELFLQVCAAVAHAHRNLVVHRDLKPSNILVSSLGEVKLLDFGIAKLLATDALEDELAMTATGEQPMTPRYSSPEQRRGAQITTSSDVYSLGLVLYELLTGGLPDGRAEPDSEPTRPSGLLAQGKGSLHASFDPRQWSKALAGDLDRIVLKAMAHESERRYGSVDALAEDLRRYLDGRPVLARGDSWLYRTCRFVQRHRWSAALAFATVLTIALLGGQILLQTVRLADQAEDLAAQRDQAEVEKQRAERISGLLIDLFRFVDPVTTPGGDPSAVQILDQGTRNVRNQLADQPAERATMLDTIGVGYSGLQQHDKAREVLKESITTREQTFGRNSLEIAGTLGALALVEINAGHLEEAEVLAERAVAIRRTGYARPSEMAEALYWQGMVLRLRGRSRHAQPLQQQALVLLEAAPRTDELLRSKVLTELSYFAGYRGDWQESLALIEESTQIRERVQGSFHADTAEGYGNLGHLAHQLGRFNEAEDYLRKALAMHETILGRDHLGSSVVRSYLAHLLMDRGQATEATLHLHKALELVEKTAGKYWDKAVFLNGLGISSWETGAPEAARSYFERSLEKRIEIFGEHSSRLMPPLSYLGHIALEDGRSDEALEVFQRALALAKAQLIPAESVALARIWLGLGKIYAAQKRPREARAAFEEAHKVLALWMSHTVARTRDRALGAVILFHLGRTEETAEAVARLQSEGFYNRNLAFLLDRLPPMPKSVAGTV